MWAGWPWERVDTGKGVGRGGNVPVESDGESLPISPLTAGG